MSRLEEIKEFYKDDRETAEHAGVGLILGDYDWLIQQAERVEELEEQLQAIFFTMVEVDNMKIKLERYKHALEFYANDENWVAGNWFTPVDIDQGEIAEKALAGDKDD